MIIHSGCPMIQKDIQKITLPTKGFFNLRFSHSVTMTIGTCRQSVNYSFKRIDTHNLYATLSHVKCDTGTAITHSTTCLGQRVRYVQFHALASACMQSNHVNLSLSETTNDTAVHFQATSSSHEEPSFSAATQVWSSYPKRKTSNKQKYRLACPSMPKKA